MKRGRISNDNGDAVMVTAVMMLSIILSVGSNLLLQHGENVGKESDMTHVTDVEDSLLRTRASMNSLLRAGDTRTTMIDRFTLGTYGSPYIAVARSSGTLSADPEPDFFQISLIIKDGASENILNTVSGGMEFVSNNYYYLDQTYYFTSGGVVLDQYGSEVVKVSPDIHMISTPTGIQLQMYFYGLTSSYWKITGIESLPVSVRMAGISRIEEQVLTGQTFSIRVNGVGEKAWYDHLTGYLSESGLMEGVDFVSSAPSDWNDPNEWVEIDIPAIDEVYAWIGEMEVSL